MPLQSIELLLDTAADEAVRSDWDTLVRLGLPSQARHSGESNAPHVTVVAAETIGLPIGPVAPVDLRIEGLLVLGTPPRGLVLARAVALTSELLALHDVVMGSGTVVGTSTFSERSAWTPHITLGSRMTTEQVDLALAELDQSALIVATASLRHWNGETRVVTELPWSD